MTVILQISDLFRGPDYHFCLQFRQAMVIDFDSGSTDPALRGSTMSNLNPEETPSKGKSKETKKVSQFICQTTNKTDKSFALALQVVEKRPEVRFLEYADIPGILKDTRLLKFQKLASAAKKHKSHHLATCSKAVSSLESVEGSVLSERVLEEIPRLCPGDPSFTVVHAQVADMEQEVRNLEFRLQFLWNQRKDACQWLANARENLQRGLRY
jgi:hypothetical protein